MSWLLDWLRDRLCESCPDPMDAALIEIGVFASSFGDPRSWAAMYFGMYGRLPANLQDWQDFRAKNWAALDSVDPHW